MAATKEEPVLLRRQDARGVVTLTLNRPHAFNALSEAMLLALQRELDAIAHDESVRVIVLAAEGKAFCAGHDLKEMPGHHWLYERLFAQCAT
jgi:enoyl-CoA hydratase/carnithine racemase